MLTSDTFCSRFTGVQDAPIVIMYIFSLPGGIGSFGVGFQAIGVHSALCQVFPGKHGTINGLLKLVTVLYEIYIPLVEVMTRGRRVK